MRGIFAALPATCPGKSARIELHDQLLIDRKRNVLTVRHFLDHTPSGIRVDLKPLRHAPTLQRLQGSRNALYLLGNRPVSEKVERISGALETLESRSVPQWLEIDPDTRRGVVKEMPNREDITLPIDEQLIVELYSR